MALLSISAGTPIKYYYHYCLFYIKMAKLTAVAFFGALLVLNLAVATLYTVQPVTLCLCVYQGSSLTRGKQKPPDAKTQQLAEQAYEELLDHVETVSRNYVLDDSK